jgi:hypothetical protein
MWFWAVNEMIELVSGMPVPQFGDESSWVQGSELVLGSSGSCVSFWSMQDVLRKPVSRLLYLDNGLTDGGEVFMV